MIWYTRYNIKSTFQKLQLTSITQLLTEIRQPYGWQQPTEACNIGGAEQLYLRQGWTMSPLMRAAPVSAKLTAKYIA